MAFKFDIETFVFVDFEASSLDAESWPIEVGLAWIAEGRVHSWSSLIRPQNDWKWSAWSEESAKIHGITRSELDTAPPAGDIAREYIQRVDHIGKKAVSDAPEWDHAWAQKLLEAANGYGRQLLNFDHLVRSACRGNVEAINHTFAHLEATPIPHRAEPDAERMATAVLQGMRVANAD
ncbi:exonuclease domain-containing protein [Loktanella salsilacus]|uniref:3'-5' exonuclease n=1 Tax=Loktanella salsilacus TaxID=195913 RepID=UPI003704C890